MKRIPVILFGAGGVGQALLEQIADGRACVTRRNHCRFDVVAVADSRSWIWQASGLDDDQLQELAAAKRAGLPADPDLRERPPTSRRRPSELDIIKAREKAFSSSGAETGTEGSHDGIGR
ncbi:MAG: hypothetical protein ACE5FD_07450 [Anaerolineae bacterium]